jgi:hypothetical protein
MACEIGDWLARVRQALRGRYVRLLEEELSRERAEVARLRDENRALLNSLLGTAGVPPIETPRPMASVPPVRRRSWPQIATAREIEAARQARADERRP